MISHSQELYGIPSDRSSLVAHFEVLFQRGGGFAACGALDIKCILPMSRFLRVRFSGVLCVSVLAISSHLVRRTPCDVFVGVLFLVK